MCLHLDNAEDLIGPIPAPFVLDVSALSTEHCKYGTGAKQIEGGLLLHVDWQDGYTCWADHSELKSRQYCKDELIRFYESKIRKVPRSQK